MARTAYQATPQGTSEYIWGHNACPCYEQTRDDEDTAAISKYGIVTRGRTINDSQTLARERRVGKWLQDTVSAKATTHWNQPCHPLTSWRLAIPKLLLLSRTPQRRTIMIMLLRWINKSWEGRARFSTIFSAERAILVYTVRCLPVNASMVRQCLYTVRVHSVINSKDHQVRHAEHHKE